MAVRKLSEFVDLETALSQPVEGMLQVDVNETITSSVTVPEGTILVGCGGILFVATTAVLTVRGLVQSNVQLFDHIDHSARGVLDILLPIINIRWFGALNGNEPYDVVDNTRAIESAWLAGRKASNNQTGATLYIPGPIQFFCGKIDFGTESGLLGGGQRNIKGDGQRGSLLRLALNEDTGLLKAVGAAPLFNGSIQGVWFNGNRLGPNVTTEAVVEVDSYNFKLSDCYIEYGAGDGVLIKNAGQIRVEQVESEKNTGWGFVARGVNGFTMENCGAEQNGAGGLLIEYDPPSGYEHNRYDSKMISNFYSEANGGPGICLAGVGGVTIDGITTGETNAIAVHLTTYDDSGILRASTGNVIKLHGPIGSQERIVIDEGCINNIIFIPHHEFGHVVIEDANPPGLNTIKPRGGGSSPVRDAPPSTTKDYANTFMDSSFSSHPLALTQPSQTVVESLVDSFLVHPASAYVAAENRSVCMKIVDPAYPSSNRLRINKTNIPSGDYWVNVMAWADYSGLMELELTRQNSFRYDWSSNQWTDIPVLDQQKLTIWLAANKPQWVSIPFKLSLLESLLICDLNFAYLGANNPVKIQYFSIVDKANAGLIYFNGTTALGANDHFESTTANLPPAENIPIGTKVWDLTIQRPVYCDGTKWIAP